MDLNEAYRIFGVDSKNISYEEIKKISKEFYFISAQPKKFMKN